MSNSSETRKRKMSEGALPEYRFELKAPLDELLPKCLACQKEMIAAFVTYSFHENPRFHFQNVAGYKCEDCELFSYRPEAILEALTIARDQLLVLGQVERAESLIEAIASKQRLVKDRAVKEKR